MKRDQRINFLVFLAAFLFYLAITGGNFWESDGQAIYNTAKSLVNSNSFSIDCFWETAEFNNLCYSKYGLFASISIVPFYLLDKLFVIILKLPYLYEGLFSSFANIFYTSILVSLFYSYLRKLNFSPRFSIIGTFLLATCTYLPAYTKTLFSEPLITLLIYASIYLLIFHQKSIKAITLVGVLTGLTFLTKFGVLIYLPCFLLILKWRRYPLKSILIFSVSLFISLIIFFFYNYIRLNNPFDAGYRGIHLINTPFFYGLYLNLFSPGKSLFLYQPIIILSFWGFKKFHQTSSLLFHSLLLMTVINFIFYAIFHSPTGDLAWGSRYLYTSIPFFIICSMFVIREIKTRAGHILVSVIITLSLVIQISSIYLSHHRYRAFMDKTTSYNSINTVYNNPLYSPLLGQWKMILRLGYQEKDQIMWREAFQEYTSFNNHYFLAPPDLIFLRSKREFSILILVIILELYIVRKIRYEM